MGGVESDERSSISHQRASWRMRFVLRLTAVLCAAVGTLYWLFLVAYALSPDNVGVGSEGLAWLSELVLTSALWWITIRTHSKSGRIRRAELMAFVLVCGISISFLTSDLANLYGPTSSERAVDTMGIKGYLILGTKSDIHNGEPETTRYYIGPPLSSPLSALTNTPGLTIESSVHGQNEGDFDSVGSGQIADGCTVDFLELRHDTDPGLDMNISDGQRKDVMNGHLAVLVVDVLCGAG